MKAVFDTNILIDLLANEPEAFAEFEKYESVAVSRISWMEVLVGADDSATRDLWKSFLDQFEMIELDAAVALEAISQRKQFRLKLPDALIYASALTTGAVLVTRNSKDFERLANVRIPYVLGGNG